MYIYVFRQVSIDGTIRAKVGVSRDPSIRDFGSYGVGGFSLYRSYPMKSRAEAFALEAVVCRSFPVFIARELLDARPEDVCEFIEELILNRPSKNTEATHG